MAKFGRLETIKDFKVLLKELSTGLRQLTFNDNFESFEIDLNLTSGEEKNNIRNQLKIQPSRYIIVFQTGNGLVTAGDTAWDNNYISFKNHGSNTVDVKIKVLR